MCIYIYTYISSGLGTVPTSSRPSAVSAATCPRLLFTAVSFLAPVFKEFSATKHKAWNIFGSANWGQRGSMHLTSHMGWTFFPWNREKLKPPGGQSVDSYTNQIWCWSIGWILMLIMYIYIYIWYRYSCFFPKHIYKILKVVLFDFSGVLQFYWAYIRYHVVTCPCTFFFLHHPFCGNNSGWLMVLGLPHCCYGVYLLHIC